VVPPGPEQLRAPGVRPGGGRSGASRRRRPVARRARGRPAAAGRDRLLRRRSRDGGVRVPPCARRCPGARAGVVGPARARVGADASRSARGRAPRVPRVRPGAAERSGCPRRARARFGAGAARRQGSRDGAAAPRPCHCGVSAGPAHGVRAAQPGTLADAYRGRGRRADGAPRLDPARAALERAPKGRGAPRLMYLLAGIAVEEKDWPGALAMAKRLASEFPADDAADDGLERVGAGAAAASAWPVVSEAYTLLGKAFPKSPFVEPARITLAEAQV